MTLKVLSFTLGPLENNSYLLVNENEKKTVVIDPSFSSQPIYDSIQQNDWKLQAIWLTHAHFDHIAGCAIASQFTPPVPIALHPGDLELWKDGGGALDYGFTLNLNQDPTILLQDQQELFIGNERILVSHTPGHSPGHVTYYSKSTKVAFCGDLIFRHGVGRTDLPGGSFLELAASIRSRIYTLPPDTRLLSGHGPETTVFEEMLHNPFVNGKTVNQQH